MIAFANKMVDIVEVAGHHSGFLIEWSKVTVVWWSHSIKGLLSNDFIMAAKTDTVSSQ